MSRQFCRTAVMDAAEPIPEDLEPEAGGFPAWLIALLALLRRTPSNTATIRIGYIKVIVRTLTLVSIPSGAQRPLNLGRSRLSPGNIY